MKITIEIPDTAELSTITLDKIESIIQRALSFTQDRDNGSKLDLPEAHVSVVSSSWTERPQKPFRVWLKAQVARDDVIGDLAKDAIDDKSSPAGRATKAEWHR